MASKPDITAREMSELLIARVRAHRDLHDMMQGGNNKELTLRFARLVVELNDVAADALGTPVEEPAQ